MSQSIFREYRTEAILIFVSVAALGFTLGYLIEQAGPIDRPLDGLAVGESAPPIRASAWINGAAPSPEALTGEVVVLEVWASYCFPCQFKTPQLVEAYEQYKDKVQFIGLTSEGPERLEEVNQFLVDYKVEWPNGYGPEAVNTIVSYQSNFIPEMWVIGRDGKVVWNHNSEGSIIDGIELALNPPAATASAE
ncbi:MAG: TlpA disulfide reductase family protein [Planctomycetaceae bacterium]